MRPTDSDEVTPATAKPNGVHTPKRSTGKRAQASAANQQKLADFAAVETPAMDAEMWPVHAMAWLQPGLTAAVPLSSGLRIERRHRVPVPDFLPTDLAFTSHPPAVFHQSEPLLPRLAPVIPPCDDLSPLGWDPRTVCPTVPKGALS